MSVNCNRVVSKLGESLNTNIKLAAVKSELQTKSLFCAWCVYYLPDMQIDSIDIQVSNIRYRTLSNLGRPTR